ncbi:MAG: hypothetical protein J6P13_07285, partial [Kiritimatiellae bacterium]|nr:hypothetical protein [Kiritimatiellia bacterium]
VGRADLCPPPPPPSPPIAVPVEAPLPMPPAPAEKVKPWVWNKYLATTETGYLLFETDSGIVTVNPRAARERIAFEKLASCNAGSNPIQDLLLPEMVRLSPAAFARIEEALDAIRAVGFRLEPFGKDTIKVEAVPLILGDIPVAATLSTIAEDLASTGSARRSTERWREDAIAKSIAKSFAGMEMVKMDEASANLLVEDLIACRMPYVTPAGKSVMIFTSLRELDRKFGKY